MSDDYTIEEISEFITKKLEKKIKPIKKDEDKTIIPQNTKDVEGLDLIEE